MRSVLGIFGLCIGLSRITSEQAPASTRGDILGLAKYISRLSVIKRGNGHQWDLELLVDFQECIASRVGYTGNGLSPSRDGAPGEVDLLDDPSIIADPDNLYPPVKGQEHSDSIGVLRLVIGGQFIEVNSTYPIAILDLSSTEDGAEFRQRVKGDSPITENTCFPNPGKQEDLLDSGTRTAGCVGKSRPLSRCEDEG